MLTEICVPEIRQSESKPSIGRWFKQVGDPVSTGEPLVEIETGGKTIELQSPINGSLSEIHFRDGEYVRPGDVVGTIAD